MLWQMCHELEKMLETGGHGKMGLCYLCNLFLLKKRGEGLHKITSQKLEEHQQKIQLYITFLVS